MQRSLAKWHHLIDCIYIKIDCCSIQVESVKDVFIFRFQSPLYFANISIFRSQLSMRTGIDPLAIKIDDKRKPGCFESCFNKVVNYNCYQEEPLLIHINS